MSLIDYRPNNEGRRGVPGRERAAGREEWQSAMRVDGSQFAIPPALCPREFVSAHFGASSNMAFLRGTTTLAFSYAGLTEKDKGGICVAADSRASSATYVSSKTVCKILDIAPHMCATMAGGAADYQYWIRQLGKTAALFELEHDHAMSVAAASDLLAVVALSCCYHKLNGGRDREDRDRWDTPSNSPDQDGYPMSAFVRDHPDRLLTYSERETACHGLGVYRRKLEKGNWADLRSHLHRAVLERALATLHHRPKRGLGLGPVKTGTGDPVSAFLAYATAAVAKNPDLEPILCLVQDWGEKGELDSLLSSESALRVSVFFALRLLTAPLVESAVLLDRALYLMENGLPVCLIPLFDPEISARNTAIVSWK